MANRLKMAISEAILRLHERRWSGRRIALELDIDRETVSRHLALACGSKPAKAPLGSEGAGEESKPAKAPLGSDAAMESGGRAGLGMAERGADEHVALPGTAMTGGGPPVSRSRCAPWRAVILEKLELGLSAQRIFQDLVVEQGFEGKYYSVRRYVERLGRARELPFRRLECGPGEEAQVDFGTGAPIVEPNGRRRRPHVLRLVLSHSRKAYSQAVWQETTEDFIRCLEDAFWAWGGVPKTLVIDNLRAAVHKPDRYDPDLNPKLQAFCAHYGVVILPTRPRTPRHKGKIERGIGYVKGNALKGRTFTSLEEENRHLAQWEESVADKRLHGTTRQQVGRVFREVERPALQALPVERFPFFHEAQRSVHRDGHVEVAKAYYSVPPEYLGRLVWVRWDARLVRIFDAGMQQITIHARREPGQFSTQSSHIASEKINSVERGAAWMLSKAALIGPGAERWAKATVEACGVPGVRVVQGLLALGKKHRGDSIDQACETAASYGSYRLKTIRELLVRRAERQQEFDFLQEHPLIRSLAEYADVVHASFQKESQR
jgi:transposase